MAVSYWIFSENKYIGSPSVRFAPKIELEDYKSMQVFSPSIESGFAIHTTSNNSNRWKVPLSDFLKYGNHSPQMDDVSGFEGWKEAGEANAPNLSEYFRVPEKGENSGVGERFVERLASFPVSDTPLQKYVHDVYVQNWPINDTGKAFSLIENLRQSLLIYYRTEDAQELIRYATSVGYEAADIDWLEVGFLPERALYGVGRTRDGEIFLTAAEDVYDKNVRNARLFGIDPEAFRHSALLEEKIHIDRRSFDKDDGNFIREEMRTKAEAVDYYLKLAKAAKGNPKLERLYLNLAEIKEYDRLTTPERYREDSSSSELEEGDLETCIKNNYRNIIVNKDSKYENNTGEGEYVEVEDASSACE